MFSCFRLTVDSGRTMQTSAARKKDDAALHDGVEYGFEAVFGSELSAALGGDRPIDRASAAE